MAVYQFDSFILDAEAGVLRRQAEEIPLQPLAFEFLHFLVQNPGRLVTRSEISAQLWPGVALTSNSLDQQVRRIRKALSPSNPLITVPRRGYRFEMAVHRKADAPPEPSLEQALGIHDQAFAQLQRWYTDGAGVATLIGPYGVGKTTVAKRLCGVPTHDIVFCDLNPCRDRAQVCQNVGRMLALEADSPTPDEIGRTLHRRGLIGLCLDGAEGAVEATAALTRIWSKQAPQARIFTTSRVRLNLKHEHLIHVTPLSQVEATRFFVEQAGLTQLPKALPSLVQSLDRLPLAMDLAALRSSILSVEALVDALKEGSEILQTPQSDRPPRHQSLNAAMAVSWNLLSVSEQQALSQLTVFEGHFSIQDAMAILADGPRSLDLVQRLVDCSVVHKVSVDQFYLFRTLRHFVQEASDPLLIQEASQRHSKRFIDEGQPNRIQELRSAVLQSFARGDTHRAVQGAVQTAKTSARHPDANTERLLRMALEIDAPTHRKALLAGLANCIRNRKPEEAKRLLDEALTLCEPLAERAELQLDLAAAHRATGHLDASDSLLLSASQDARSAGDASLEALALIRIGNNQSRRGATHKALEIYEQALALYTLLDDIQGVAAATSNIAIAKATIGDLTGAERRYLEVIELYQRSGGVLHEANVRGNLAVLYGRSERVDEAFAQQRQAIALSRQADSAFHVSLHLTNLAYLCLLHGELKDVETALEEALPLARAIDNPIREAHALLVRSGLLRTRDSLRAAGLVLDETIRLLQTTDDAVLLVEAYLERAEQALHINDLNACRQALTHLRNQADPTQLHRVRQRLSTLEGRCQNAEKTRS